MTYSSKNMHSLLQTLQDLFKSISRRSLSASPRLFWIIKVWLWSLTHGPQPCETLWRLCFHVSINPPSSPPPSPPPCQRLSTILWVKRWVWVDASAHPAAATVTTVFIKEEGSVPTAWLVTSVWLYCGQPQLIALYCSLKVLYCKSTHSTGRGFDVRI